MSRGAVTRLLGRLKIHHGTGTIEFRLRNPREIDKRGVVTVVRIDGLGEIPLIEDGKCVHITLAGEIERNNIVSFDKERHEPTGFYSDRRERSERNP